MSNLEVFNKQLSDLRLQIMTLEDVADAHDLGHVEALLAEARVKVAQARRLVRTAQADRQPRA